MIVLSNLILALLLTLLLGFFLVTVIYSGNLNIYERLGLSLPIGMGVNTLMLLLLFLLKINITFGLVAALLGIINISLLALIIRFKRKIELKVGLVSFIFLFLVFLLVILPMLYYSLNIPLTAWDEFSYWATASKRIFLDSSVNLRGTILPFLENYPLLIPLNGFYLALANGGFTENIIKIFNPLYLYSLIIFLYGYFARIGLKKWEAAAFLVVMFLTGNAIFFLSTAFFADLTFAVYYNLGIFIILIAQEKNEHGLYPLAGLCFALLAWTKTEGYQLAIITIFALIGFRVLRGKLSTIRGVFSVAKEYIPLIGITLCTSIMWKIITLTGDYSRSGYYNNLFKDTDLKIMNLLLFLKSIIKQIFYSPNYYYLWVLVLFGLVAGLLYMRKNNTYHLILIFLSANIAFFLAIYLFVFSYDEFKVAAELYRYGLRLLPFTFLVLPLLYRKIVYNDK